MKELFKEAIEIIKESKSIVVAYHPDADGITSVILVEKKFPDKKYKEFSVNTIKRDFFPDQMKKIKEIKPDLILNLDVTPMNFEQFSKLSKRYRILTIDHHQVLGKRACWNKELYINPCISGYKSEQYSCSKIVQEMLDDKENDWLAAVGLISDSMSEFWIDWLKQFSKNDMVKFKETGDIVSVISMAYKLDETREYKLKQRKQIIKFLKESSNPNIFISKIKKDQELYKFYLLVEEQLRKCVNDIKGLIKKSEDKIILYEVKGFKNLAIIKLLLGHLYRAVPKSKILIFYQKENHLVQFRALNESPKINCALLLSGFGGGHRDVAGGGVPLKDFNKTLKLIEKRAKKQLENI